MTLLICKGCGKLVDQRHRCENLEIILAREAVRQEAREIPPIQFEPAIPRKLHWAEKQRLARKREKTRLRVQKMRERRKAEQAAP